MQTRNVRISLIVATAFLGITAVPGGAMLLSGIYTPPVEMLGGSLFTTFTIPGLALALVVGGSALVAHVLLLRRSPNGFLGAAVAGLAVMTFEVVQVISIGSPPGSARVMQAIYFVLGLLLLVLATVGYRAGLAQPPPTEVPGPSEGDVASGRGGWPGARPNDRVGPRGH